LATYFSGPVVSYRIKRQVFIMAPTSSTNRWIAVLGGIVAVLFGIFAFAMPGTMLASLVIIFGAFVIVDALILLVGGIAAGSESGPLRWILVAGAVVALILGVLAVWNPIGFAIAITLLIGVWSLVSGIVQVFAALALRPVPYWWVLAVSGVLGVIVGMYIVLQPVAGTVVLVWALGLYAIVYGVGRLVSGLSSGKASSTL
jgi:uncharacterized membrane protein HdeD (DUF308 family)